MGANAHNEPDICIELHDAIEQNSVLTTLDLYSEEKLLRDEGPGLQRITRSRVTVGKTIIKDLGYIYSEAGEDWAYYSVYQPFTLHRIEGDCRYFSVVFQITLDDPSLIAVDLFPKEVMQELHVETKLSVTPNIKFNFNKVAEVDIGGHTETDKTFITLVPQILAYGEGEREFYWEYTPGTNRSVYSGTKQAVVLLRVPLRTLLITGKISYEVVIEEPVFGRFMRKNIKSGEYPIAWTLK